MTIYLDLDRTLLDTNLFNNSIWRVLEKRYKIESEVQISRISEFITYKGELSHYDYFAQLSNVGLDDTESVNWLQAELQKLNLLFDDTVPALDYLKKYSDVEILTYGTERNQMFKLECCEILGNYKWNIVFEPKSQFFNTISTAPAYMIDDKLISDELPTNVKFIHLNRSQSEAIVKHKNYQSINCLIYIKEIL